MKKKGKKHKQVRELHVFEPASQTPNSTNTNKEKHRVAHTQQKNTLYQDFCSHCTTRKAMKKQKKLPKQKIERKSLFFYIIHLFQCTNIYITPILPSGGDGEHALQLKMCIEIEPIPTGGRG